MSIPSHQNAEGQSPSKMELIPEHIAMNNVRQAENASAAASMLKRPRPKVKLTLLSLWGINIHSSDNPAGKNELNLELTKTDSKISGCCVSETSSHVSCEKKTLSSSQPLGAQTNDLRISASVSFTGSCGSNNIRVVSSKVCPATGRLAVQSQDVVVPDGMEDGLMAIWDDSTLERGHSPPCSPCRSNISTCSSKKSPTDRGIKGFIPAKPDVSPHVIITLPDPEDQLKRQKSIHTTQDNEQTNGETGKVSGADIASGSDQVETTTNNQTKQNAPQHSPVILELGAETNPTVNGRVADGVNVSGDPSTGITSCLSNLNDLPDLDETDASSNSDGLFKQISRRPIHNNQNTPDSIQDNNCTSPFRNIQNCLSIDDIPLLRSCMSNDDIPLSTTPLPEIIEMQVSLEATTLLSPRNGVDPSSFVYSSCPATAEGGGAVAHVMLFPDDELFQEIIDDMSNPDTSSNIMQTPSHDGKERSTMHADAYNCVIDEEDGGRILELPVRKITPLQNLVSSSSLVSASTGLGMRPTPSIVSSSGVGINRYNLRCNNNRKRTPYVWVDLDEDAILRVKIQPFTKEDEDKELQRQREAMNLMSLVASQSFSSYEIDDNSDLSEDEDEEKEQNKSDTKDENITIDYLRGEFNMLSRQREKDLLEVNPNKRYNASDDDTDKPHVQDDLSTSAEDTEEHLSRLSDKHKSEGLNISHRAPHPKSPFCAPGTNIVGIFNIISQMMTHCAEDVVTYDLGNRSMGSTIFSDD
mmetsp:Transcript_14648/g.20903  ORF Transcript_14648/g.20903 Transcript_14648/m.20903 type:complete len:754 (+) Transcript_14648:289-2550(+)|eukprot:CAMPEP_0184869202 /NCGR_PEP_ID=MMETSP0580-20130426/33331_1 /TAXON_ID=1118495 /ORGANISM="Dactyliosolen fragilissimus" /LENGTH=753 /DNA_ID=CAMNT_0027370533 /DNA_START=214 /DNA_END=2475 /DNA_ORIENTATION=-